MCYHQGFMSCIEASNNNEDAHGLMDYQAQLRSEYQQLSAAEKQTYVDEFKASKEDQLVQQKETAQGRCQIIGNAKKNIVQLVR
jgi:hypothetical protein